MKRRKKIVYIAGKINGDPNFVEKFKEVEVQLKEQGYIVLNPADLPGGMEYEEYMTICFAMVDTADILCMLPDYKDSPGALREFRRGKDRNKAVVASETFIQGELIELKEVV